MTPKSLEQLHAAIDAIRDQAQGQYVSTWARQRLLILVERIEKSAERRGRRQALSATRNEKGK